MTINQMANMNFAYRNLYVNNTRAVQSMRNLSSGYRINSASDDAAGLGISERMRGYIGGLSKAYENAQAGYNLASTADGALSSSQSIVDRMRELAVQASNGTYSDDDRALLDKEFQSLKGELDRISNATNYNGMTLLDGTLGGVTGTAQDVMDNLGLNGITATGGAEGNAKFTIEQDGGVYSITAEFNGETITQQVNAGDTNSMFTFEDGSTIDLTFNAGSLKEGVIGGVGVDGGTVNFDNAISARAGTEISFQIGANGTADSQLGLNINDMSSYALGLTDVNLLSASSANSAISALDSAKNVISSQRAEIGAVQNTLEHSMNNLATTHLNLSASESKIRDADMALQYMNFTQRMIQQQANMAMMAQGMNLARQNIMSLLMR